MNFKEVIFLKISSERSKSGTPKLVPIRFRADGSGMVDYGKLFGSQCYYPPLPRHHRSLELGHLENTRPGALCPRPTALSIWSYIAETLELSASLLYAHEFAASQVQSTPQAYRTAMASARRRVLLPWLKARWRALHRELSIRHTIRILEALDPACLKDIGIENSDMIATKVRSQWLPEHF
ncbi:DUF1127 domain-containing protein [Ancylobacter defluvii]|uniref:DUF1127 domain-containing protein n=1 Tax=Ancylobacter defluvii TaxID=1282440 RepID=A0A9W6JZV2_9HYPH|nr:DUF1127 domain-containing protein [Ancylobacter defluvii]MBS7585988.1 DUF1127 domain-containing protein [Ancylobacter defluvii]GLK84368.1 hypothetical protein GCM10017653_24380 [Ancylobacter defluvii]